jgi:hypothetical protein
VHHDRLTVVLGQLGEGPGDVEPQRDFVLHRKLGIGFVGGFVARNDARLARFLP